MLFALTMSVFEIRFGRIYIVWQIELGFLQEYFSKSEKSPPKKYIMCQLVRQRQQANAQAKPEFNLEPSYVRQRSAIKCSFVGGAIVVRFYMLTG